MKWTVVLGLHAHPWVLPTALAWWLVAVIGWLGARSRRLHRGEPPPSGWALVFWCAVGGFAAVTLTPSRIGLGLDPDDLPTRWCLPQWPRTGFGLWAPNPERRWNVLIGVPLGLAALAWPLHVLRSAAGRTAARPSAAHRSTAGRTPALRSTAPWTPVLAPLVALAAPAAVELGQAELPGLGRLCAVVDAVDNLSGVLLGFALAVAVGAAVVAARRLRHGRFRSNPRRA